MSIFDSAVAFLNASKSWASKVMAKTLLNPQKTSKSKAIMIIHVLLFTITPFSLFCIADNDNQYTYHQITNTL